MLIKLPEGFQLGIHWEEFGIYHLICGCDTIPNVVYFHPLSATLLGQGKEGSRT